MIKKAEVDLNEAKEALQKEKENLKEKEKAFDCVITSHKQKSVEESQLIEELKLTKELLTKAQKDIENKNNSLDAEMEKVKASQFSTKTLPGTNYVSNVKQEQIETNDKDKKKTIPIPCKYFHKLKGCRRGSKCWFSHKDQNIEEKKNQNLKQNFTKKFKDEPKVDRKSKQDQDLNLKQGIIELLKLVLREINS